MPLQRYFDDWDCITGAAVSEASVHFSSFQKELQCGGRLEGESFWSYSWCCLGGAGPGEIIMQRKALESSEEPELLPASHLLFLISSTNTVISTTNYNDYFLAKT